MDKEKRRTRGVPMLDAEWNAAAELGVLMGKAERGRPVSTAEAIRRAVSQAIAAYGRGDEQEARTDAPMATPTRPLRSGASLGSRISTAGALVGDVETESPQGFAHEEQAAQHVGMAADRAGVTLRPFLKQDQIRKPKK